MKDRFCFISYDDIVLDKTYTNISEYFLRQNQEVDLLMRWAGSPFESGSDFELLTEFLRICKERSLCFSSVGKSFSDTVKRLIGEENAFSLPVEELWVRTSEALLDDRNKLRAAIASTGLESIGVAVERIEEFDAHFVRCGAVGVSPIFCPFGTDSVSLDTLCSFKTLNEFNDRLTEDISKYESLALFFNHFFFEIPNEYVASKAYGKHLLGQPVSRKETDILKAQLVRTALVAAAESEKEVMVFLPLAPDVRSMGAVAEMLEYIDESDIKVNATVYAGDAVSLCMARSISGKKYKNITAATGLSGNGSNASEKDILNYWGAGEIAVEKRASLARTAAHLIKQ